MPWMMIIRGVKKPLPRFAAPCAVARLRDYASWRTSASATYARASVRISISGI
jgi:hypothetical protein